MYFEKFWEVVRSLDAIQTYSPPWWALVVLAVLVAVVAGNYALRR